MEIVTNSKNLCSDFLHYRNFFFNTQGIIYYLHSDSTLESNLGFLAQGYFGIQMKQPGTEPQPSE